ncbi:DUF3783 domain-containing protein [Candidatus Clostridium stratigraminis]|uniref:DUF3783 domain-containing protein n=1 Tax=Candidatus Clostridium stratigraminis TaxID=3381661 RepID=A0ABW8T7N1_9CLOT
MNNNKMTLIYGFNEEEKALLHKIFMELQLPKYKVIENNMANMKLKDIINGLMLDTYDKVLPAEKIILFNNFTDEELDKMVRKIRENETIKPILAVVTPTSINWEFYYLVNHLLDEREQAKKYIQQKSK